MAAEPDDFRDTIKHWHRLTREQRAAAARRLVGRSRGGDPMTEEMVELLALLKETGKVEPRH